MAIYIKNSFYNVNIFPNFQMQSNGFPVPTAVTGNTSAPMNQTIRVYLQALVNNNLVVSYHLYKLFLSLSKNLRAENTSRRSI